MHISPPRHHYHPGCSEVFSSTSRLPEDSLTDDESIIYGKRLQKYTENDLRLGEAFFNNRGSLSLPLLIVQ